MNLKLLGPGPVIHGPDMTQPGRYIVQRPGRPPETLTPAEIATIPISQQWFTTTVLGQIASWSSREIAESRCDQVGVMLGQVLPMECARLAEHKGLVVILADVNGRPLRGAEG